MSADTTTGSDGDSHRDRRDAGGSGSAPRGRWTPRARRALGWLFTRFSAKRHAYRYDAFISYAREDAPTAQWLKRVLERTWVPGRRRRVLFLDTAEMIAGRLTGQLTASLRDSRFLIVCGSAAARESAWVDLEIDTFVALHGPGRVLACRVGPLTTTRASRPDVPRADAPRLDTLPRALGPVEASLGDQLLIQDLRHDPQAWRPFGWRSARRLRGPALGLLAPLVDLPNRSAVETTRLRRRLALGAALTPLGVVMACYAALLLAFMGPGGGSSAVPEPLTPEAHERLRAHLIDFKTGGQFVTTPAGVDAIFHESLERARQASPSASRPLRILLCVLPSFLVDEESTLQHVGRTIPWWRANGIYPIFVKVTRPRYDDALFLYLRELMWSPSAVVLGSAQMGARAFGGRPTFANEAIAQALAPAGTRVWESLHANAAKTAALTGAFIAGRLDAFVKKHPGETEIHLLTYSDGAVTLNHLLPALRGIPVQTMQLLAPSVSVTLFEAALARGDPDRRSRVRVFALRDAAERDDTMLAYQGSLLYLVRDTFGEGALLGLEEDLRARPSSSPHAIGLVLAPSIGSAGDDARSAARRHGDFDDDPVTMDSVARWIVGADGGVARHPGVR